MRGCNCLGSVRGVWGLFEAAPHLPNPRSLGQASITDYMVASTWTCMLPNNDTRQL